MPDFKDTIEVKDKGGWDVAVVGGGMAGVAAALAARRAGCSVLLLEKTLALGGLATNGLVVLYNPALCDVQGRVLVRGLSQELRALSVKYGYGSIPNGWKQFNNTFFNPHAFVLAAEELLADEGVTIVYDTFFSKPVMEGRLCRGVIAMDKGGFGYYAAKMVVDATGDCDVMHRAGCRCVTSDNWLTYWALSASLDGMARAAAAGDIGQGIAIERLGAVQDGENQPEGVPKYACTTSEEITRFVMLGRQLCRQRVREFDKRGQTLVALPALPQVRDTRRVAGAYTLTEKDRFVRFDDSIGCFAEEVEPDQILEIPYRTLYSPDADNLLTAGRSVSSEGSARDLTRLIAVCALTGEAAGGAAALAIREGCAVGTLPVPALQRQMQATGNELHY